MTPCMAILLWRPPLGAVGSALFLLLPAICLALVHRRMRRRHASSRSLFLLLPKVCLFLLLLLAFFDPIWGVENRTAGTPKLLVLVDDSSSMEMPDDVGISRRQRAKETLARISRQLGNAYDIEHLEFDTSVRSEETTHHASATVRGTDLGTCLLHAAHRVDEAKHAAVLLLTDGGDTRVQSTRRPDAPLLIIGFGREPDTWNDLRITELTAPPSVNLDTDFEIDVTFALEGERLQAPASNAIILRLAEETENGLRHLRSATIPLENDAPRHSFRINSGPDPRSRRFSVFALPMEGEASVLNNRRDFAVEVRRKQVDVFVYADTVNWDIRYLRTALDADPDVRLTTMTHVTDTQTLLQGVPLHGDPSSEPFRRPFNPEVLNRYQCLILPPLLHRRLSSSEAQALISYVDGGGGVVMLGSSASGGGGSVADTGLSVLRPWMTHPDGAPVIKGDFPVSLARGALGHVLARDVMKALSPTRIPRLMTIGQVGRLKTAAVPLFTASVEGVPIPVIAMQPYGGGMVLGVATDSLWLWHREGGASRQAYERFWRQAVRYLGGQMDAGRLVSAQWDRAVYQPGEEAHVALTVAGHYTPGELRIEGRLRRTGTPQPLTVTPRGRNSGTFDCRIAFPQRGEYTIAFEAMRGTHLLERYQKVLPVGATLNEGAFLEVDHAFLQHLARRSVDRYARESHWQEIPPALLELAAASTVFATHALIEFQGIYLTLVLLVLLGEWLLRRKYNLF